VDADSPDAGAPAGETGILGLADRGTGFPQDKIRCQGTSLRYVVACMHNCRERHYCNEFWEFFRARGITPAQYAGQDAIGEVVMKRVVFDCDRCGKKDVGEPFSAYRTSGPDEGAVLDPAAFHEVASKAGPAQCPEPFLLSILGLLKEQQAWEHLCEACFRKVAGLAGGIVGRPVAKPVASEAAKTPVARALAAEPKPVARVTEPKVALKPEPRAATRAPEPKPVPAPKANAHAKPGPKPVARPLDLMPLPEPAHRGRKAARA